MAEGLPLPYPPLWTATKLGQMDVVRKLLEDGADIQEKGGLDDTTPLHQAARYGREQIMQLLIEHETDVSAKATGGVTPLHTAASKGREAVALLLI